MRRVSIRRGGHGLVALFLLVSGLFVGTSASLWAGQNGAGVWLQVLAALAAGFFLPLMVADKLLSWFTKSPTSAAELRWMIRTVAAWHLIWLVGAHQGLQQTPSQVANELQRAGSAAQNRARDWLSSKKPGEAPPATVSSKTPSKISTKARPVVSRPKGNKPAPSGPLVIIMEPDGAKSPPAPAPVRAPPRVRPPARNPEVGLEVAALAGRLVAGTNGDKAKLAAIHKWVTENIAYDVAMLRSGRIRNQDPATILSLGRGVCQGYSELTQALLAAVGIESRIVDGWARSPNETWAKVARANPRSHHAWNEVKIDGRWATVDTTWDAGYTEGDRFVRRPGHHYLDPSAEVFARSHTRVRPRTTPANAQSYYFQLPRAAKNAARSTAFEQAFDLTVFRGKTVKAWDHGISARYHHGKITALVMVQTDLNDVRNGCRLFTLERRSATWKPAGVSACPAGGSIPNEGWEAPPGL